MTFLQWYALVGVPLILLAGGYGALRLAERDRRNLDHHTGPAE